jgi:hypothetical protein
LKKQDRFYKDLKSVPFSQLNCQIEPFFAIVPYMLHQVEEMTKKFIKSADDMCKAKEKEISGN